jgi:transposase
LRQTRVEVECGSAPGELLLERLEPRRGAMKNRRKFTARQRVQVVLEGLQTDTSVAEVCRRYGISTGLYYRWRDQLFENADRLFEKKGQGSEAVQELEVENRRLKEVIAEITAENLDLKKTPGAWRITPPFRGSSGR